MASRTETRWWCDYCGTERMETTTNSRRPPGWRGVHVGVSFSADGRAGGSNRAHAMVSGTICSTCVESVRLRMARLAKREGRWKAENEPDVWKAENEPGDCG